MQMDTIIIRFSVKSLSAPSSATSAIHVETTASSMSGTAAPGQVASVPPLHNNQDNTWIWPMSKPKYIHSK